MPISTHAGGLGLLRAVPNYRWPNPTTLGGACANPPPVGIGLASPAGAHPSIRRRLSPPSRRAIRSGLLSIFARSVNLLPIGLLRRERAVCWPHGARAFRPVVGRPALPLRCPNAPSVGRCFRDPDGITLGWRCWRSSPRGWFVRNGPRVSISRSPWLALLTARDGSASRLRGPGIVALWQRPRRVVVLALVLAGSAGGLDGLQSLAYGEWCLLLPASAISVRPPGLRSPQPGTRMGNRAAARPWIGPSIRSASSATPGFLPLLVPGRLLWHAPVNRAPPACFWSPPVVPGGLCSFVLLPVTRASGVDYWALLARPPRSCPPGHHCWPYPRSPASRGWPANSEPGRLGHYPGDW